MTQGSVGDVVDNSLGTSTPTSDAFSTWFDAGGEPAQNAPPGSIGEALSAEQIGVFALVGPDDSNQPSPVLRPSLPLIASVEKLEALPVPSTTPSDDAIVIIPHPRAAHDRLRSKSRDPAAFTPQTIAPQFAEMPVPLRGSAWTIPILCLGMAMIAACLLIPLADENRQLMWEREQLRLDLEQIDQQVAINNEFLKRVSDDPTLAERLAQREMKTIRANAAVLNVSDTTDGRSFSSNASQSEMSPFLLVNVPPPAELTPYQPIGGILSRFCRDRRPRAYTLGVGMLLVATGLILGYSKSETT